MRKILLIDDEIDILKTVGARLKVCGYEVITAEDGEEGLKKIIAEKPDLIVCDVMMPKMDGYTLVRKMKYDNSILPIPIIMLTAKERLQDLFELEGVRAYITKPFKSEELLKKIKELIQK
ncbi:MAG: response regulator [Candidatus Omnitrophota bacterium]